MDNGPMRRGHAHSSLVTCLGGVTPSRICLTQAAPLPSSESPLVSMASISSEGSTESPIVEQEEIAALTHDVRTFKEALGKLKRVFSQERERLDSLRVSAHERLSEVLRILRSVLEKYSPLQSPELLSAAGTLIQHAKGYNYENEKADPREFFEFIDQLALAFSSRVSEYLMGDLDIHVPASHSGPVSNKTKSCENIASDVEEQDASVDETRPGWLSPQQLDGILLNLERGVEYALHRAKLWSKYIKDIMMYVEKRAHTELEFTKNMIELCHSLRPLIKEEDHLPLQPLYCAAMDHDLDNSRSCQVTCGLLLGNQFLEPMFLRRNELERTRKNLKEIWQKELKKMHEAISGLRKSRSVYIQWQREFVRDAATHAPASEDGSQTSDITEQLDKGQCFEVDAMSKAFEAESAYRAAVAEANEYHTKLQKVKSEILHQVRELIIKCDQTIKAVTVKYFQIQNTLISPVPIQFQTLHESSKLYEPGLKYMEFVKQLPSITSKDNLKAPFAFEPYHEGTAMLLERKSLGAIDCEELGQDKYKAGGEIITKSWGAVIHGGLGSDTDSISSSPSSKSQDTSPTASPMMPSRKLVSVSSGDELENDQDADFVAFEPIMRECMSKAAITHNFRKLKTPSRCRECDTYVYFQGADCSECGLACHKKCLETLAIQCGHKRLPRKMTTFGVELGQHLKETSAQVPSIVCKCVNEIDERGKLIKGVYRVSGVKSKVEKLCQAFENGVDLVDLTGIHPNVIANVLKLYLRQLPEPLLTFRLYTDFVRIAKDFPSNPVDDSKDPAAELKAVIKKLPKHHYATLSVLMQHLKRVSEVSEANKMPASNLGIVFGPTLLRTSEGSASLSSLVDTVHQTRAVELIIIHAYEIFGPTEIPMTDCKVKMKDHQISRSSSSVMSNKSKRMEKDQEVCTQALTFDIDLQEEAVPNIHDGKGISQVQKSDLLPDVEPLFGTSDDELPDFLLSDNSFKKIPISGEGLAQSTEKILKVSLRDYKGLEGMCETSMEFYSYSDLFKSYGFPKKSVTDILPMIPPANNNHHGLPIPPLGKLITALHVFTSGSFQFSSSVNTTAQTNEKEHMRLKKSRSDVTPKTWVDPVKGDSLDAADRYSYINISASGIDSLKEEISNLDRSVPIVERDHHLPLSSIPGKDEESQSYTRNTVVDKKENVDLAGLPSDISNKKTGVVDETNRCLNVQIQKEGNESCRSTTSEPLKESHSMEISTKFLTENQCSVMMETSPKLSKICMAGVRGESPFDSDYSLESNASSSIESRSPRDYDDERGKMTFPSNLFDVRHSLTASETKQKVKHKGMLEVGEVEKTLPKTSCKFSSKTLLKCDTQETQQMATSDIFEGPSEESSDRYSINKDRKQQGTLESLPGQDGFRYTSPKSEDRRQYSVVFTNQEKSQHGKQCTIVKSTKKKPSQPSKEKQLSVIKSQLLSFASREAKVLVPTEAAISSSSLKSCATNHQEVKKEPLSYSCELQKTSGKKILLQADGERKALSEEMVEQRSCNSMPSSSRGVTACINDHVVAASAQKSVIHRTVNVSQTARITNLTQAQSVASFSQTQESVVMGAQSKKELRRD